MRSGENNESDGGHLWAEKIVLSARLSPPCESARVHSPQRAAGSFAHLVLREGRRPATALVITGPFRISRNPLYLSLLCLYVGIAIFVNGVWPLLLTIPPVAVLRFGVIGPAERYLEWRFGDVYRRYRSRVRRWL